MRWHHIAPRVDDTPGGDNGGGDRVYSGGPGVPVPAPVEHADYLVPFDPPAGRPTDLVAPARVAARPSRHITQRHSGGAAGAESFEQRTFTGGHSTIVRAAGPGGTAASAFQSTVVTDTRSRFLRRAAAQVPTNRTGAESGSTGDALAPVGTPQQQPYPTVRTERRRSPMALWNGGAR